MGAVMAVAEVAAAADAADAAAEARASHIRAPNDPLSTADRVGLGWRGPLAAGIYANLEHLDVLEIVADSHLHATRRHLRSLRALGREVPLVCHGVSLGLASVTAVATWRIERLARVLEAIEPASWSEHLAFVRAGGHEIGHLAAPPRTLQTVEGSARNVEHTRRVVGLAPALENIATLIDPPGSVLTEARWISAILEAADGALLLDLHNLHANCVNFGHDAHSLLPALPLQRVNLVHISGGRMIASPGGGTPRLLDDHLHDVPDAVYTLLTELAALCPNPLTVIIERDGRFPEMPVLLHQVERARQALAAGRRHRAESA
jgi:uncharacterized protein (UPF0276 family)